MQFGGLLYMVAYNLRKVENRDRYPDPPQLFVLTASGPVFVAVRPNVPSELAQRKRAGLITQRSYDRNVYSLRFYHSWPTMVSVLAKNIGQRQKVGHLAGV